MSPPPHPIRETAGLSVRFYTAPLVPLSHETTIDDGVEMNGTMDGSIKADVTSASDDGSRCTTSEEIGDEEVDRGGSDSSCGDGRNRLSNRRVIDDLFTRLIDMESSVKHETLQQQLVTALLLRNILEELALLNVRDRDNEGRLTEILILLESISFYRRD